jgi:hypothetical protein
VGCIRVGADIEVTVAISESGADIKEIKVKQRVALRSRDYSVVAVADYTVKIVMLVASCS